MEKEKLTPAQFVERWIPIEQRDKMNLEILVDGRMNPVHPYNPTAQEVFDWWLSGESIKKYFGMLRNQTKLDL